MQLCTPSRVVSFRQPCLPAYVWSFEGGFAAAPGLSWPGLNQVTDASRTFEFGFLWEGADASNVHLAPNLAVSTRSRLGRGCFGSRAPSGKSDHATTLHGSKGAPCEVGSGMGSRSPTCWRRVPGPCPGPGPALDRPCDLAGIGVPGTVVVQLAAAI